MEISYKEIEKLHAAARRERAREVYRVFCRAAVWVAALFTANRSTRALACCPSAA